MKNGLKSGELDQFPSESIKTKRIREKLKQQLAKQEPLITKAALTETIYKIHEWIAANSMYRIRLRDKDIRLFDQNQHTASLSRKVQHLAQEIRRDMSVFLQAIEKVDHQKP